MTELAASILDCDFLELKKQILIAQNAGINLFHLDVMDGYFVPNISFGVPIIKAVRKATDLPLYVHLMVQEPAKFISIFGDLDVQMLTIHQETSLNIKADLKEIKRNNKLAGVAINPDTKWESLIEYFDNLDLILLMSVYPGFGGQSFIVQTLEKIKKLKTYLKKEKLSIKIEVDGGITEKVIPELIEAGADILVVGAYIFKSENIESTIKKLKEKIRKEEKIG